MLQVLESHTSTVVVVEGVVVVVVVLVVDVELVVVVISANQERPTSFSAISNIMQSQTNHSRNLR